MVNIHITMLILLLFFIRALSSPAHPSGGPAGQHHCPRRRGRKVRLQSLQRRSASHPVAAAHCEERQPVRSRWSSLRPRVKGRLGFNVQFGKRECFYFQMFSFRNEKTLQEISLLFSCHVLGGAPSLSALLSYERL